MPIKALICDTPDGLAQLQYTLIKAGAGLEMEVVTDGFRAVEVAARTQPEVVVAEIGLEGRACPASTSSVASSPSSPRPP
jgi:hypothetical protein